MKFLKNLRNLVLRFDLFSASPTLRTHSETDHEHLCCGVFSFLLVISFIDYRCFGESSNKCHQHFGCKNLLNKDKAHEDTEKITDIRFAIGIDHILINETSQYLSFQLKQFSQNSSGDLTITPVDLEYCTLQTWKSYGEHFQHYFSVYNIDQLLCIPENSSIFLKGYQGSSVRSYLRLAVKKCTRYNCANDSEINSFVDNHLNTYDFFKVRLLLVNTLISPTDPIPTQKTLAKDIFLTFGSFTGTRGRIILGRYEIETDESIWPFAVTKLQEGHYIEGSYTNTIQTKSDKYVVMSIQKSSLVYYIQRSHRKFDDLLAYIGGLFALIYTFLVFIISPFNEYRYELMVAEHSFTYDNGQYISEKDLSVFLYIKYVIYAIFKQFGITCDWPDMKKIHDAREQATKQLDAAIFTKKVKEIQKMCQLFIDEHLLISSQLMKPISVSEAKKRRKILEYHDKIIRKMSEDDLNKQIKKMHKKKERISSRQKNLTSQQLRKSVIRGKKQRQKQLSDENQLDSEQEEQKKIQKYIYEIYFQLSRDPSKKAIEIRQQIPKIIKRKLYMRVMEENNLNEDYSGLERILEEDMI